MENKQYFLSCKNIQCIYNRENNCKNDIILLDERGICYAFEAETKVPSKKYPTRSKKSSALLLK